MRAVIQRSGKASVEVEGKVIGKIEHGLVVLLGVHKEDTKRDAKYLADKIANLRIFPDENDQYRALRRDISNGGARAGSAGSEGSARRRRKARDTGRLHGSVHSQDRAPGRGIRGRGPDSGEVRSPDGRNR